LPEASYSYLGLLETFGRHF